MGTNPKWILETHDAMLEVDPREQTSGLGPGISFDPMERMRYNS